MINGEVSDFCSAATADAYKRIFNAENYLRFIVKWELVGRYGAEWRTGLLEPGKQALKKMEEEARIGLIDDDHLNIMSYLLLSDLRVIITDDANWPLFSKAWGKKEFLSQQLVLFNRIRAKVMHSRALTLLDIGSLDRTLETIATLTRAYRKQMQESVVVEAPAPKNLPLVLRKHLRRLTTPGSGRPNPSLWRILTMTSVGCFWRLSLALEGGAFSDDAPLEIFSRSGRDCFFAAAAADVGEIDLYIPQCISDAPLEAVFKQIEGIRPLDGREPFPDDVDDDADRYDGLFRLPVALPVRLRLST